MKTTEHLREDAKTVAIEIQKLIYGFTKDNPDFAINITIDTNYATHAYSGKKELVSLIVSHEVVML